MTEEHAILEADFATWRPVQGRKVLQLVFEVPLEKTQEVLAKLGTPLPGQSIWVAIAKLDLQAQRGAQAAHTNSTADKPAPSPGAVEQTPVDSSIESAGAKGRKWSDIPYSQRAAILCDDPEFQRFIMSSKGYKGTGYDGEVAQFVRHMCGVESRADIKPMTNAGAMWLTIEDQFEIYKNDLTYGAGRR